jgi:hypothetical protein
MCKQLHHGGDVCGIVVLVFDGTFCATPTVEILQGGSFLFLPEPIIAVKLFTADFGCDTKKTTPQ